MIARRVWDLTAAGAGILLLAALGVAFASLDGGSDENRVDILVRQQILLQNLTQQAWDLGHGDNALDLPSARKRLGGTILLFDRLLTALLQGGIVADDTGAETAVAAVTTGAAKNALAQAAALWYEVGMPLADLAAGEFSPQSVEGRSAIVGFETANVTLGGHLSAAATALRTAPGAAHATTRRALWCAGAAAILLAGILMARWRRRGVTESRPPSAAPRSHPGLGEPDPAAVEVADERGSAAPSPTLRHPPRRSVEVPTDLDIAGASVDRLAVDMNTIASSTEKMRTAIDTVGVSMQGLLYSLNELADDTAEGYKVVRNTNNAASFTAASAQELSEAAREMGQVVGRVIELAQHTRTMAQQVSAEAAHTGRPGAAFNSVVAQEVKSLAAQTAGATAQIEETVAEILSSNRQYEESIGQIIKNVSSINKVIGNLGEAMLEPPATVQPGTPLAQMLTQPPPTSLAAPPTADVPAPTLRRNPAASELESDFADGPETADVGDVLTAEDDPVGDDFDASAAIPATEQILDSVAGETGDLVAEMGERAPEPQTADTEPPGAEETEPETVDDPDAVESAPATDVDDIVAEPREAPAEATDATTAEPPQPTGSAGNIFMLNKPKKPLAAASSPADGDETTPAETALESATDAASDTAANTETATTPTESAPEPVGATSGGGEGNIFVLNKSQK